MFPTPMGILKLNFGILKDLTAASEFVHRDYTGWPVWVAELLQFKVPCTELRDYGKDLNVL